MQLGSSFMKIAESCPPACALALYLKSVGGCAVAYLLSLVGWILFWICGCFKSCICFIGRSTCAEVYFLVRMAGIFCVNHFKKRTEMVLSPNPSDEEIAYRLQMLYLPHPVPHVVESRHSQRNYASSSTSTVRKCEARYSESLGFTVTDEEQDFLEVLGMKMRPGVQEMECGLCTRVRPLTEFMSTEGCSHMYCTKCCKEHAERSILSKCSQIECPHPNCRHVFVIDQCKSLLSKASLDILNMRKIEADFPVSKRIYCPFEDCSAFIPLLKSESSNSASDTFIECYSCNRGFCLECNVPWKRECDMCGAVELHKSFISTKDCGHEYCTKCCKEHAESEILSKSSQIKCPHPTCRHNFDIDQCRTLLSEKSFDILNTRQTEAAIPISQRLYCPFEDCSAFIPLLKSESSNSASDTFIECYSCNRGFCLECNVPWESECDICAETKSHKSFISTTDCVHEYCTECCMRHAEQKLLSGTMQIKCPEPNCSHNFDYEQLSTLLSPPSFNILSMRLVEAAFPASQKVYCPYQDCSVMMEKSETDDYARDPFVECYSCNRGFCVECNIPWHESKTCGEYRADIENAKQHGDQKLVDLANTNKWRECPNTNCRLIIERTYGCNHITCRCGHEWCYRDGSPWVNKKPTCSCPLYGEGDATNRRAR